MGKPAIVPSNVSLFEALPVSSLRAELDKFKELSPYLGVSGAARLMQITQQGARVLHDRCALISAGRDALGHCVFRRDGCIAYRWSRRCFGGVAHNEEQGGWDVE
ncbi:MAG: hypothetical protein AAFX02_04260 [Pseudomonadota bacterium]